MHVCVRMCAPLNKCENSELLLNSIACPCSVVGDGSSYQFQGKCIRGLLLSESNTAMSTGGLCSGVGTRGEC